MKEIKLHYTEELFRQAVRAKHFPSLKDYRAWIVPVILLSGGCFVLLPFVLGKHDWILVVVAIAAAYKVILRIRTYREGLRWMLRAFRDGIYEGWTLSYTEEELTVSGRPFSVTTPWKGASLVIRRPTYWILDKADKSYIILPLDCLDEEDRKFITRKTWAARSV